MDFDSQNNILLPVLPLRGIVVFPKSLIHFDVGRSRSISAINKAMKKDRLLFLSAQKDASKSDPDYDDIFTTGVIAKVAQVLKQPENVTRIVIEGVCRAQLVAPIYSEECMMAEVKPLTYSESPASA
ncbi:MAG: LON peptidase substrate-binding domain-containing protein, partial [Clostridiales bacterium]|nr:LON peptidase substrate-binding domain-containing protein [Clostridiales bacterium]